MKINVGYLLYKRAMLSPKLEALVVGDVRRSYKELNERANRAANAMLKMGLKRGDRVAVLMEELVDYDPDLFVVYSGHNEFLERRTYPQIIATPEAVRDVAAKIVDRVRKRFAGKSAPAGGSPQPVAAPPPPPVAITSSSMLPVIESFRLEPRIETCSP